MRQRDVAALDAKYTKELADVEENDAFGDDKHNVVGCTSKQSVSRVKPPLPPA